MNSYVHGFLSVTMVCMQLAPNLSAAFTPDHLATGWGARQRSAPTGGAANGIPLNAVMEASRAGVPDTIPPETLTGCEIAAKPETPAIRNRSMTFFMDAHTLSKPGG